MSISAADFNRLDTDKSGYLDANELQQADEQMISWDTDSNGQVTQDEFMNTINQRDAARFREGQVTDKSSGKSGDNRAEVNSQFTSDDFNTIDLNKDGSIDRNEWKKMGLDDRLFDLISGPNGKISQNDWDEYLSVQAQGPAQVGHGK